MIFFKAVKMKRIIKLLSVISVIFLILFTAGFEVSAEGNISEDEIQGQVDEILSEYDISYSYDDMNSISFSNIFSTVKESLFSRIKAPFRTLGITLIIIVFISFVKNAGETAFPKSSSANLYAFICVISAVAVISPSLLSIYENSAETLQRGGNFMLIFVPIFAGISIMSGGVMAVGIYNASILTAAELMVQLSSTVVMPVLTATAALSISGSVFPNSTVDSIVTLMRKVITWGMTVTVTLFVGFLSVKSVLGSAVDGFASKTAKFVISGFVPVVGSAVSDAYSTVKGSFDVMRCTAGTAGTIAIALIMLPPILEIMAFRAVLWISGTAAGMFSVTPLEKLFKSLDSGLAIALGVLVCFSVLFIISTAILMKSMT